MKRAIFQNIKTVPYESGDVIDRANYLSLIFAAAIVTAGKLTLTVTHSDDGATFTPAKDTRLEANDSGTVTTGGVISIDAVGAGDLINVDIDLVGCKQFVKIAVSGTAEEDATYAYTLGDAQYAPV